MQGTSTCRWQSCIACSRVRVSSGERRVRSASLHGWASLQARGKVLSGAPWPPETRVLWWIFTLRGFLFLYPPPFFSGWRERRRWWWDRSKVWLSLQAGMLLTTPRTTCFARRARRLVQKHETVPVCRMRPVCPPLTTTLAHQWLFFFFHLLPLTSWIMGFIVWIICFSLCSRKRLEQQLAKLAGRSVWAGIHNCPLSALCRLTIIVDGSILADAWQTRVWYSFTPSSFVLGGGLFYYLPTETIIFSKRSKREDSCLTVGSTPWSLFLLGSWLGGFLAGGFTLTGFIGCRAFVLRFLGLKLGEEKSKGTKFRPKEKTCN